MATRIQKLGIKGGPKRADYILYAKPNVPIAVVEAKRNIYPVGHGMQQALGYAEMLDAPFVLSSNSDGFLAPYKVIRVVTDVDALGYAPEKGKTDKYGELVEQRQYNTADFDRHLILEKRTELVARRV